MPSLTRIHLPYAPPGPGIPAIDRYRRRAYRSRRFGGYFRNFSGMPYPYWGRLPCVAALSSFLYFVTFVTVLLVAVPAQAIIAPDGPGWPRVWHGPGANPCEGRCGREWALRQIGGIVPAPVIDTWRDMLRRNAPMRRLHVLDGDSIIAMGEGGPHMIRDPLLARLDGPEPGMGWVTQHEGKTWIFIVVDACTNPAVLVRQGPLVPDFAQALMMPPVNLHGIGSGGGAGGGVGLVGRGGGGSSSDDDPPFKLPPTFGPPEDYEPPSVVPLPAPLGMMLAAVGMLAALGLQGKGRRAWR